MLIHADPSKQYFLETDASGTAIGAVLSQKDNEGKLHPIVFMSSDSPATKL